MGWNPADLCDRADIIDTQHRYAMGIDRRDWALYRSVFADRVRLDFTQWHGGEPLELEADEWVARVAARQTGFDATQHQMSNHLVKISGDEAECTTYVIARHCIRSDGKDEIQAIGGYYVNRLTRTDEGWKITNCTLNVLWTQGDAGLFDVAARKFRENGGYV